MRCSMKVYSARLHLRCVSIQVHKASRLLTGQIFFFFEECTWPNERCMITYRLDKADVTEISETSEYPTYCYMEYTPTASHSKQQPPQT
jgi:hypothetical protein